MEENPIEMVTRSIKGMIPKNKMRKLFLAKVKIFEEGGHDLYSIGLPQFGKVVPVDYNKIFGLESLTDEARIIHSTIDIKDIPEPLKKIKVEIDPELNKPDYLRKKPEYKINPTRLWKLKLFHAAWRRKHFRRIRNMSYTYI